MEECDFCSLILWALEHPIATIMILPSYFTIWMFVIMFISLFTNVYKYVDMLLLTIVVAIFGLYITYVHPQQLTVFIKNKEFTIRKHELRIYDLVFHQVPFVVALLLYGKFYRKHTSILPTLATLFIILIYISVQFGQHNYGFTHTDIVQATKTIIIAIVFVYAVLLHCL